MRRARGAFPFEKLPAEGPQGLGHGLVFRVVEIPLAQAVQVMTEAVVGPLVDFVKRAGRVAVAEVMGPAGQGLIQFPPCLESMQVPDRFPAPLRPGHVTQIVAEFCQRLRRGHHVQVALTATELVAIVPQREPQEVEAGSALVESDHLYCKPLKSAQRERILSRSAMSWWQEDLCTPQG